MRSQQIWAFRLSMCSVRMSVGNLYGRGRGQQFISVFVLTYHWGNGSDARNVFSERRKYEVACRYQEVENRITFTPTLR